MFAELDGESVTGVDCDGMVFDPNNFKAKREVICHVIFREIFFSSNRQNYNSYFVPSIIVGLFYPLVNNVFVYSLKSHPLYKNVSAA